jgi:hypothetical protein
VRGFWTDLGNMMQEVDEFQAYVLVRRWSQEGGEQVVSEGLSQRQRGVIQAYYFNERNYINSCLDYLLQSDLGDSSCG